MKGLLCRTLKRSLGFLLILFAFQGQAQKILDNVSATPAVAYSLRQVKNSATKAIQVRRSSDNLTMDIGFTAGGDLDQAALLSFVGANSAYVTIWYDQTGNGHDALQATLAKQPRIVNAGVVDVQNGRPICDFNGVSSTMASGAFALNTPLSLFLVQRRTGTGTSSTGYVTILDGGNNNTFKVGYPNVASPASMGLSPQDWNSATSLQPVPQLTSNTLFLYSALTDASSGVQYLNGGVQSHSFPGSGSSLNGVRLFRGTPLPADNELPAGQLSEVIIFGSKLSAADRQLMECSESAYYSLQIIPAGLEFYISGTVSPSACTQVQEEVVWQNSSLTNVVGTGNNLSKFTSNGNWDGGAASWNTVSNNGYFQFVASETNKARMAGLSTTFTSSSYTTIQYAFYLNNGGGLQIYESGNNRGTFSTYTTGDVLKIAVESGIVKYYKNGVLLYISTLAPALPLLVDASLNATGSTVTGATVMNYNAGSFTATATNAGASPSYQWLLNGSPVGTNSNTYTNTSLNVSDVVSCVLTPNITGCSPLTIPSNNITNTATTPLNLDFSIQGTATASSCNFVTEQVKWNLSTIPANTLMSSTGVLSKFQSGAWDGGAASWNTVSNNGYLQFTATETNRSRMAGLSTSYTSASFTTIQYAFFLVSNGTLQIYESGVPRGGYGSYTTGDVLKISVESNVVKYYKNGTLLYISGIVPTLPMLTDVSLGDVGSTLGNAQVSNYNTGTFTANTVNAGVSPTYQWLLNGSPVGTNSNTYTNAALNNNDVVSCMLTPNLPGCSAVPVASNTITETILAPLNLDFSIQGTSTAGSCNSVIEQVKWKLTDLTSNMNIVSTNGLSKFQGNAWDGGAASWNTVSNNGYLQFTASETNKARYIGLSTTNANASNSSVQYAFYLTNGGNLQIVESGSGRGGFGAYIPGDILKISVESGVVRYYKNGALLYISGVAPSLPMLVDVSIYDAGGTISNALVSNYNAGTFTANAVNAGASPTYQWLLNGSPVGTNSNTYTNASLSNNDVVSCMLTPNLTGCTAVPVASNTITETIIPPLNLDFSIQGTAAASSCNSVIEQVKWNLSNLSTNMLVVSTNSLSKFQTGGWNGGAASWNTVSNNGYFQFTTTETNKSRMAGLSSSYTSSDYTTIQYAFYPVNGGSLQIYESGSYRGTFGTYTTGDILKISVESNVVKYYKNGALLYISQTAPTLPMLVDVSVNDVGGTITNAMVSNYNTGTFTANVANAGVSPTYQWLLNGSPVGTNSNTYTNTALNNNDVVTCMLTPNLPGCSTVPVASNTITETVVPPLNLDFSIQGTAATTNCTSVIEQVKWNLSTLSNNMTVVSTNGLSKFQVNAWNGGAASWNTVSNNGYFQFTATEINKTREVGLSSSYTSSSNATIQYGFYLANGGSLQILESGSGRGTFGTYTTGDILKISVEANVVKYYKNGALLYISNVAPGLPMLVDVSIYDAGGTISNALVSNYNTGTFTANAVNAGVSPTYQWLLNGSPVGTNSNTYTNASLSNNDVVSCTLLPDLTGCSAIPVTSNTITEALVAPLGLDFSIQGTAAAASCNSVIEQVKWNLSNVTNNMTIVSVNSLSKFQSNGVWDGGAASWNTVSNNGYFQFTATETNKSRMAGLSASYTSASYTTIQYAFYLTSGGNLQIYESGVPKGGYGAYTPGDILKISVEANTVKYYKNGTLLYISATAPTLPMLVDVSLSDVGSTIGNALVSNYNTGTFTANVVNAGTSPSYQWLLNGSPVGTNSNTYTNTSLSNNDVVTCVLTPDFPACNVLPVTSNTITESIVPPLGLDFSIQGTPATSSCNSVIEQVEWNLSDLSNNMTIVSTNSLSKFQTSGNWNGGAGSWNTVSNNGYFQFTATETNRSRMAGLSTAFTSSSYTTIQYAFFLVNGGSLQIYESGSYRGTFGTYTTGDILKISVESNVVKYYKNGTLLYISNVAPSLPMLVDVSIEDAGGTITNALVSNYNTGTFTATAVNAGTSPSYQWLLNGSPVGTNSSTYTNTSLSNNDVVTCVLSPDFPACNALPVTSNTITESIVPPLGLDFSIQGTPVSTSCSSVTEQVKWKLSNLTSNMTIVSTNSLSKFQSNAWDGGAASWNTVSNNGYLQFTATETNKSRMAGLSTAYTSSSYTTIQYAFYLVNGGSLQIYESGSGRGAFGTYTTGDVLKISVESNVVKYYKNGTLLYISGVAPSLPLLADVSINDPGGTITNALISNYNTGTFTANAVNAGASPTYQWLLNGSPVGTNSNTYTNASLNNNDVVSCTLTPDASAGCNAVPVTSNTITESIVPPLGLDFSIQGTAVTTSCSSVIEQVKWKLSDLTSNMTIVSTNSLSKFQGNAWDGGAASWNTVSDNGYFQFTATETNKTRMAGLSNTNASAGNTTIQYGFYLANGGSLQIQESGSGRGGFGTYTTGDILKISVESGIVKYYKNGTLLYVSGVVPTLPLLADVSIYDAGGTVTNALISNYNTGTFTANAVNAGASPTYQWLLNGSPVGTNSNTYTNASLSNNDVVSCMLTPNLAGCTAVPVASNTITEANVAPLNLDFAILGTTSTANCISDIEQVKWRLSNLAANMAIVSTNSLIKNVSNGNWDGGASSWNTVSNNGYFQFTASETSTSRMAGLSTSYTSASYNTIQYAFYLVAGGSLQIYESGSSRGGFGTYTPGDILKITVESNAIRYYKNGTLLYVSTVAPVLPLLVDVSVNNTGGTISNALVSNYISGVYTASTVNAGSAPDFKWMVNGTIVQTGPSATYTNIALNNNDVVSCVLTPNLPGCTTLTYNSNTITNTVVPPFGLDFAIQGVVDASSCGAAVLEQVKWKLSNLSTNMNVVATNGLSKYLSNGNWDGGAASWNTVSNNGYLQFTAGEITTNKMAGLSTTYTSTSYTTIQYAFYLNSGSLGIYESGANKGGFGTYIATDVLKISVESNVVKYYKNGVLLRVSTVVPVLPLLVDVSINSVGGTITNAFVSNPNSGSFTASSVNAGASPIFTWMVNGSVVQTGTSATYNNPGLSSNDVVTCSITPNLPGCSAGSYPSNTVTYLKAGNSTTWTGSTSTNWFTPTNWSSGVPDKFTSATISGGTPNNPTMATDASVLDITISSGATLTMSGSPNLFVYRNWTNNGAFVPGTGTVNFVSCSGPVTINSSGTETFYNVVFNSPYGITIGSGTQQISKVASFTSGIITQNATLTFLNGSSVVGASDASHVNGVVTKVGTGAFTFPVGSSTTYRPISISSPGSATDVFTAQYIPGSPNTSYSRLAHDPTLNTISSNEYWMLNRTNGASNVSVTLSWNLQSGTITSMGGLHVAGWSTAQAKWKDLGSGGTTGSNNAGTVVSSGVVTAFGAFTLSSLTVMNVLPIQLLYFQCNKINSSDIDITWATSIEQNSAYFTLERSSDGINFEPIGTVNAAGNSDHTLNYRQEDLSPLKGMAWYRLKMTDLDGQFIYSMVDLVDNEFQSNLVVYPNPTKNSLYINFNDDHAVRVSIIDNTGRAVIQALRPVNSTLVVDVTNLQTGLYFVLIDLEDKTRVIRKILIQK